HRDRRHPVRGLGRHRRGVRGVGRGRKGSRDSVCVTKPDLEAIQAAADRGMLIAYWAAQLGAASAIISEAGDRSWSELNTNANRLVRALRARGVQAGDGLALMCSNRPEFFETYAAALRGGFRLTTVNWHLTGEEAGYIVDDCEATAFVADARFAESAREAANL